MEQQPNRAASTEVEELADNYATSYYSKEDQIQAKLDFKAGYNHATTLLKAKEEEIREKTEALENLIDEYKRKVYTLSRYTPVQWMHLDTMRSAEATLSKYHKEQG